MLWTQTYLTGRMAWQPPVLAGTCINISREREVASSTRAVPSSVSPSAVVSCFH